MENASPAIVARVGVVYVDAAELSVEPVWKRWLHQRNANEYDWLQVRLIVCLTFEKLLTRFPFKYIALVHVQCLFDKYITPCTESIANGAIDVNKKNSMRTVLYQIHLNMLNQFCCVFDALFPLTSSSKLDKQYSDAVIESGFVDVR